jgi:ubiquitin C-terminal hydrolase
MGETVSYVKCMQCGYTSEKKIPYRVLQLPIENLETLDDCLSNYIKPELLDGPNRYFCQQCSKKQDAQKGLAITRFPYILSINFNR